MAPMTIRNTWRQREAIVSYRDGIGSCCRALLLKQYEKREQLGLSSSVCTYAEDDPNQHWINLDDFDPSKPWRERGSIQAAAIRRSAAIMAWEAWAQSDQSTPETAVAAYEQQVNKRVRFKCDQDWITKLWLKKAPPFPAPQVCWVDHTPQTAVAADEQQQSAVAAAESYPSYRAAASLRSDGKATVCSLRIIQIEFRFLSGEEACSPMSILFNRMLSCEEI